MPIRKQSSSLTANVVALFISFALHINTVHTQCDFDDDSDNDNDNDKTDFIKSKFNLTTFAMFVNGGVGDGENFSSDHENSSFRRASLICGVFIVPIAIIGVVGNLLTIYIFSRKHMACSINVLLAGLAGIDCILLIIGTPLFSGLALMATYHSCLERIVDYLILYVYPLANMAQTASVWCMVVITLERFIAVLYPLKARIVCNIKNARLSLFVVVLVAVLYNVCRYWEYAINDDNKLCNVLKNNILYLKFYAHWLYFFVMFLIPFGVLSILNGLIINELKKARLHRAEMTRQETQEHKVAFMMVIVIVVFFICNSLAFVLNAVESTENENCHVSNKCNVGNDTNGIDFGTGNYSKSVDIDTDEEGINCLSGSDIFFFLVDFNNLLIEINSSLNFLIYYAFSQRFRKQFVHFMQMIKKCGHETKNKRRSFYTSDTNVFDQERGALLNGSGFDKSPLHSSLHERSYGSKQSVSRAVSVR